MQAFFKLLPDDDREKAERLAIDKERPEISCRADEYVKKLLISPYQ
jgi:hypothetical protein